MIETAGDEKLQVESPQWSGRTVWIVRGVCLATCLFACVFLAYIAHRIHLDHDELEHAHAAWLMHLGQRPFVDFWDNHPPWFWYLLSFYYQVVGEDHGVFLFVRYCMIITFAASAVFTYLLGRELFNEATGLVAAVIFILNDAMVIPAVQVRGDGWMTVLMLAGAWVYLRAWRREFSWHQAMIAGLLLGISFSVHPRTFFTVVALALFSLISCWRVRGWKILLERKVALAVFSVCSLFFVLLPFLIYGFKIYWVNVYQWSVVQEPPTPHWPLFKQHLFLTYLIAPLGLMAIPLGARHLLGKDAKAEASIVLFLLVGINVAGILGYKRPFAQNFFPLAPFLALLAGCAAGWMAQQFNTTHRAVGLSLLLLGNVLIHCQPKYWGVNNGLDRHIAQLKAIQRVVPPDKTYVGPMQTHPVFRHDGTRFWQDLNISAMKAFSRIDPTFQYDMLEELNRTRPYIIHVGVQEKIKSDESALKKLSELLSEHYERIPNSDLYRLKDSKGP